MKEQVLIHTIKVYRPSERHSFQVKLPKNVKCLTGIDFSHTIPPFQMEYKPRYEYAHPREIAYVDGYRPLMHITSNFKVGDIKLQSNDKKGIFLTREILHEDNNLLHGNFAPIVSGAGYFWTEGKKLEALSINVSGENTIISGVYQDRILEYFQVEYLYSVALYLHYEIKEEQK